MKTFSDEELEALLDDVESDLAERKRSFRGDTPKKARQAVCAFANDLPDRQQPGVLFIGAKDDGTPSNGAIGVHANAVQDAKKDFKKLAEKIVQKMKNKRVSLS